MWRSTTLFNFDLEVKNCADDMIAENAQWTLCPHRNYEQIQIYD